MTHILHEQTRNAHQNVMEKDSFRAKYWEVEHKIKSIFNPEDGGRSFLPDNDMYLPNYTA
jgi:hypothetical protein